jgi:hypothetical protein
MLVTYTIGYIQILLDSCETSKIILKFLKIEGGLELVLHLMFSYKTMATTARLS